MKKHISLVLVVIMVLSVLYPCQSVISAETERKSITRFSSLVEKLNEELSQPPTLMKQIIMKTTQTLSKIV